MGGWGGVVIYHSYWTGHMLARDCPIPFNGYKIRAAALPINLLGAKANADCGSKRGDWGSAGFTGAGGNLVWPVFTSFSSDLAAGDVEQTDGSQKEVDRATESCSGSFSGFCRHYSTRESGSLFEAFVMELKLTAAVISQPQTVPRRLGALQVHQIFKVCPL